jgi:tellurium resistance protein TerZ
MAYPSPKGKAAEEMEPLTKGQHVPLKYTPEARHRILCGLSWDPLDINPSLGDRIRLQTKGHNVDTFDLDLACVMYDAEGQAVDGVSGRPDEIVDLSGKVYHSGDDESGVGENDDEQISVELKDLPENIHHIVFVVEIQSAHTFDEVNSPEARIADGMNNENQLFARLNNPASQNMTAYVFARIYRNKQRWMLHYIDEYLDGTKVGDWIKALQKYLA